jgi:AraC family transcriptional regulator
MSFLMPAGCESTWDGDTATSLRLRIPTSLIDLGGEQLGLTSGTPIELRNVFEVRDTLIERIGLIIINELESPEHASQPLIVDHLCTALTAHLLRRYNGIGSNEQATLPSGLSRFELARITEYVDANMGRPIGLAELAALVNVSRFHFARLFKRSTGNTAITFVERIRIRRSQALIVDTDIPLAEIALLTGFADQSHFTRRFHRYIGCTPAVFAGEHGRRRSAQRLHD